MGIDSPLYGRVATSMLATCGDPIPPRPVHPPRVESEIAFLLKGDIHGPAAITSVLAATDLVYGAVDVLDSRSGMITGKPNGVDPFAASCHS
ncbi:MAG TPA: hypothetical protein VIU11_17725 [Nakamurella sp.]